MRRLRTIAVLPTLFTLANLVCGFFSIVVAARVEAPTLTSAEINLRREVLVDQPSDTTNVMISAWLLFLAMLFDALDGHLARWSRATTDFGGQLDSLCDVVTFGVAPGFLLVKMCPNFTYLHRETVWVIAAGYAACAALRLARFNVETTEEDDHLHFSGLPSPAAAASIASFGILFYTLRKETNPAPYVSQIDVVLQTILPFYAMLVALLMVSRIPYPHIVNQIFRGHRGFNHIVGLLFALVAVMTVRGYAVPVLCCAFVLGGPVRYAWQTLVLKQPQREPLF
jgi:CDP-diacylglycerol--serine O-phosphatidyltransferase